MTSQISWRSFSGLKTTYHHGDLRDALVCAARQLVVADGSEHFKLADACRLAGVSTAAPYRHFSDKEELIDAVVIEGFHTLASETRANSQQFAEGSTEAISACGKAYVKFAKSQPNLFRVMFTRHSCAGSDTDNDNPGREAYRVVLQQIAARLSLQVDDSGVEEKAFPLWTFVHGLSFIIIDSNLGLCEQTIDIDKLIDQNTQKLLTESKIQYEKTTAVLST